MGKMNKNRVALAVGLAITVFHAIWALLVALMKDTLQSGLDWVFSVHFLEPVWILTSFNFVKALELVVFTFVVGCILGWIFAWCWNMMHKK